MFMLYVASIVKAMYYNNSGDKIRNLKAEIYNQKAKIENLKAENAKIQNDITGLVNKIGDLERIIKQVPRPSSNSTNITNTYEIQSCIRLHMASINSYRCTMQRNDGKINDINRTVDKLYVEMRNC